MTYFQRIDFNRNIQLALAIIIGLVIGVCIALYLNYQMTGMAPCFANADWYDAGRYSKEVFQALCPNG